MFSRLFRPKANSSDGHDATSSDPRALLKQATAKKQKGDLPGAIQALRQAYKAIASEPTIYSIDTYLRLPLYLQEAGMNDEAWAEFNRLLSEGYPNQLRDVGVMAMEHSKIYDKMRLFLQREGRSQDAVVFGAFAKLSWARGLYIQKRMDEFSHSSSEESVRASIAPLLKKANMMNNMDQLVALVTDELRTPSKIDLGRFARRATALVSKSESA